MCGLAALSLGSMPLINTWDVLIYAPITVHRRSINHPGGAGKRDRASHHGATSSQIPPSPSSSIFPFT